MKSLLVLLISLLSLGIVACGSASKGTSSSAQVSSDTSSSDTSSSGSAGPSDAPRTKRIEENELGGEHDKDDYLPRREDDHHNGLARSFGRPATAVDVQAITVLLKRYYAAAVAGDGAKACPMVDSALAKAMPVDYGQYGAPYLHGGKTCAVLLSRLFKHEHHLLTAEVPQLKLLSAGVEGKFGLALLGFGSLPERQLSLEREAGAWKVAAVLDGEVT